jgi:hypothetical protein
MDFLYRFSTAVDEFIPYLLPTDKPLVEPLPIQLPTQIAFFIAHAPMQTGFQPVVC